MPNIMWTYGKICTSNKPTCPTQSSKWVEMMEHPNDCLTSNVESMCWL